MKQTNMFCISGRAKFASKLSAFALAFLLLFSPIAPVLAEETGDLSTPPLVAEQSTPPSDASTSNQTSTIPPSDTPSDTTTTDANSKPTAMQAKEKNMMAASSTAQPLYTENMTAGLTEKKKGILETDETTGALNYSYPIVIPSGRNGLQPDLQLNYNNQQANNYPNLIGYGWNISIPYIDRINKTGTDKLYTGNYFNSSLSGELVLVSGTTYAPKVENGDFLTYTYDGVSWIVKDKKGTTYKFGQNAQSRQDDPTGAKIYKWMLEEVQDTNGNYITYIYYKDAGQIYPSAINYSGIFEVEFLRETRIDVNKSYATTFLVQTNYRISEIQTKVNGIWVRKYNLAYTTGDNGVRSLLASITESGQDENSTVTTLPAVSFDYYKSTPGWTLDTTTYASPMAFSDGSQSMLDINGDALPDIIESYLDLKRHTYLNNAHNAWTLNTNLQPPILFRESETRGGSLGGLWDQGSRVGDVNGDLLPDIIKSEENTISKGGYDAYINTNGSSWTQNSAWLPIVTLNGDDNISSWGSHFIDLNADGLNDIIRKHNEGETQINIGTGFDTATQSWNTPVPLFSPYMQFADVNGDSLPDIIYETWIDNGNTHVKELYINKGDGAWLLDNSFFPPEGMFFGLGFKSGVRFFDVNGDGLADLVPEHNSVVSGVSTYLNTGTGWTQSKAWNVPNDFSVSFSSNSPTNVVDLNSDGSLDFFTTHNSIPIVTKALVNKTTTPTDTLKKITFPQGGDTTIAYKKSSKYYDASNNLLNPNLPVNLDTVYQMVTTDGNGNTSTDTYSYQGGSYFYNTPTDKKFAGFQTVTKTNPDGSTLKTYFHQGNSSDSSRGEYDDHLSKIGKIYRTEIIDNAGNIYSKIINKWDRFNQGASRDFVKLVRSTTETYDGNATHRDTAEEYAYDDTNGNLISKINYGEVSGSDDGSFIDVGNDKFTENISYASNTANGVVSLPYQDIVSDQNGSKVRESRMYYDNLTLGSVSAGNNTKTENWKTGAAYINSQKTRNSFGLVTSSADERGKVTNYTYDTYNLFPIIVTNPLAHTTQYQYDYSSGKPKQTTDQNGFVYQTVFDGLDRVLQEKIPDSVFPYSPVVKTQYAYTDTPNAISINKTDYLDVLNSADSYQYFDGLNRLIQERKEAEIGYSTKDYSYDNRGLLNRESLPYNSSGSVRTAPTAVSELYANYTYDPLQRILSSSNSVGATNYTYDDWKTTITDANGKQKNYYKDAFDNLAKVEEINSGNIYATNYEYNGNKNLTKITDALGNVRSFTYDGLGRRLAAEDLHAVNDTTFGTYTYTYDDAGNLTQTLDPKNQNVNYTYDNLNRVLTEDDAGQVGAETAYAYDFAPNGIGKLSSVASVEAGTIYSYDSLGRVNGEIKNINAVGYQTDYIYDRQNNNLEITNPDSSKVKYIYNSAGLLNQIQRKESADPSFADAILNFDYSPMDQITVQAYANGTTTTNTYDPAKLYRLTRKLAQNTTLTKLQDLNYTYDNVGNITQVIDTSNTDTAKTANYAYDDLYRLVSANYSDFAPSPLNLLHGVNSNTDPAAKAASLSDKVKINSLFSARIHDDFYRLASAHYSGLSASSANKAKVNSFVSTVATPTITPNGGTFTAPQTVTLSSATLGASIFYTTDGGVTILAYTAPFTIFVTKTVKAIAVKIGMNNSVVKSVMFKISAPVPTVATPTISPNGGTFTSAQTVALATTTTGASIFYTTDNGTTILPYTIPFNVATSQKITTIAVKSGMNNSAIKSAIFAINIPILNVATPTITPAGGTFTAPQTVALDTTTTGASIFYTTDGATPATSATGSTLLYTAPFTISVTKTVKAIAVKIGMNNSATASAIFTINIPVVQQPIKSFSYTYDSIGNIQTRTETDINNLATLYTYAYNGNTGTNYANPHATTAVVVPSAVEGQSLLHTIYTYDPNGNMLTETNGFSNTWDYKNQLIKTVKGNITSIYDYDQNGQRIKMTNGTTSTIYPTKFYNTDGTNKTKHIFANNLDVGTVTGTGAIATIYYNHNDFLNSSSVTTSNTGALVETLDYYPYGSIRLDQKTGMFSEQRKYIGQEYDGATSLSYLNARYYDGKRGQFISEDPQFWNFDQAWLMDPQNQNSYSYARNNPVTLSDPTGKSILGDMFGGAKTFLNSFFQKQNLNNQTKTIVQPQVSSNTVPQFGTNLVNYQGSNFTGKPANVHSDFIPGLRELNSYAKNNNVFISVESAGMRTPGASIPGAVAKPSQLSNHFIGQAIDSNYIDNTTGISCGFNCFKSGNVPKNVSNFISNVQNSNNLRWGGDFKGNYDPTHVDSGLNVRNPSRYMEIYNSIYNKNEIKK